MKIITRIEAKQIGSKKYFTGKPCKRGHVCERTVHDRTCVECKKLHNKSETTKIYQKKYRKWFHKTDKYKKSRKACHARKYIRDKEKMLAGSKRWKDNHPDKLREYSDLRNTLKERQIPGWCEKELISILYLKRDELNERYGLNLEVDHIIPLNSKTVSGLHCWHNLQLLDKNANCSKGNKYQTDW
jgi:hypothetical protein